MKTIAGKYFDGRSAEAHDVQLFGGAGALSMVGHAAAARFPRNQYRIGEPFKNATLMVEFADGTHCEVASSGRAELLDMLGYRPSLVERWQAWWQGALAALVLLLAMGVAGYVWGLPAMAEWLAENTPPSADRRIGDTAEREIGKIMKPSAFSDERLQEIDAIFGRVKPTAKRMPVRLLVRDVPAIGPNAFALPNGTIVMTDELVKLLIGKKQVSDAEDLIASVLLHEIAHVENRHTMRALSRASLVAGASWFLFGDFSAVAAGAPAMLEKMSYSRAMETEADDFAIAHLKQMGMPPSVLAVPLYRMRGDIPMPDDDEDPDWLRRTISYMSTHPGTKSRVEHIYAADPAGKEAASAFVKLRLAVLNDHVKKKKEMEAPDNQDGEESTTSASTQDAPVEVIVP